MPIKVKSHECEKIFGEKIKRNLKKKKEVVVLLGSVHTYIPTMTFRPCWVGPWAMMYSKPSENRVTGLRYLNTVPAMGKLRGLSITVLPLKKKWPASSDRAKWER